jgi:hypothetical protein
MPKKHSKLFEDLMAGAQGALSWHKGEKLLTVREVAVCSRRGTSPRPASVGSRQATAAITRTARPAGAGCPPRPSAAWSQGPAWET